MLHAAVIFVLCFLLVIALYIINSLSRNQCPPLNTVSTPPPLVLGPYSAPVQDPITQRDVAVIQNTLYPPVSRDTRNNTIRLLQEPRLQPDPLNEDTFQLIGYLINREDKNDVWKLLAQRTDRTRADFYAQSSNKNIDVKIPLTPEVAKAADGSSMRPFRDIYDLPDAVIMSHPMFSPNMVYDIVSLPRAPLGSGYF